VNTISRVENILRYLDGAAHPLAEMRSRDSASGTTNDASAVVAAGVGSAAVPHNVRVQLEVWERNRARVTAHRAVLFEWDIDEVGATMCFDRARKRAKADDTLLWTREANAGAGLAIAVKASGAADVRTAMTISRH